MTSKPTYEELEQRVNELEQEDVKRKQTEGQVQKSERLYKNLIESANDAIVLTNINGKFLLFNETAASHLGGVPEDYIGKTLWDVFPKELADVRMAEHLSIIESKKVVIEEVSLPIQGKTHFFLANLQAIRSESGDTSVLSIAKDITKIKQIEEESKKYQDHLEDQVKKQSIELDTKISDYEKAEEKIRENEDRIREIINKTTAGYFFIDRHGYFQDVNEAWLKMHKFGSADEVIGRHFSETQIDIDLEQAIKNVEYLLNGEPVPSGEFSRRNKDDSIGYHNFSVSPVERSGEIIGLEGFLIDTTEKRRIEENIKSSLKEKETLLKKLKNEIKERDQAEKTLQENEKYLIISQKMAKLGHWKLNTQNQTVEGSEQLFNIFEIDNDKLSLETFAGIVHPDDLEYDMRHINNGIEKGEPWDIEHRLLVKDGTVKTIRAIGEPIVDESGIVTEIIGTVQDITERTKTENQIKSAFKENKALLQNLENEIIERKQAEKALQKAHDKLEKEVVSRTADLEATNIQLKREISKGVSKQESLQESELRWRTLTENSPDYVMLLDLDYTIQFINYTQFGVPKNQIVGKSHLDLLPDDYKPIAEDCFERVILTGEKDQFYTEYTGANGHTLYFHVRISPIKDQQDKILGLINTATDITEQKEAEREKDRLFNIVENSPDFIGWADNSGAVKYLNATGLKMTGKKESDVTNMSIGTLHSKKEGDFIKNSAVPLAIENGIWTGETKIRSADGKMIPVLQSITAHFNGKGEVDYLSTIIRDISIQKTAEYEIARKNKQFKDLIESLDNVVWAASIDGKELLYINKKAFEEIFGRSISDIQHNSNFWLEVVHPDDKDYVDKTSAGLSIGKTIDIEYRIIRPDGAIRWIRDRKGVLTDGSGHIVQIGGIATDITELKTYRDHLEDKVKARTKELHSANRKLSKVALLKDEFLANMSHELRTPLTAILGMTEALNDQVFGPMNDKQLQSIKTVESSSNHLLELINDILDVAKIEAGKIEMQMGRVSVITLCQTCSRLLRQEARRKKIEITINTENASSFFRADILRLKQIIVNLLSNAVKFSKPGGEVLLKVYNDHEAGTINFSVQDQGIGIEASEMARLFEPFEQLDSSFTKEYGGTGLGLALVRKLTEMHGGSVHAESTVGKGSCFTIILPNSEIEEAVVTNNTNSIDNPTKGEGAILLAEDNEDVQNTLGEYLENCGFEVETAGNGAEALGQYHKCQPDLILMDIQMPVMDGLQAIKRIRKAEGKDVSETPIKTTPIIALTALAMKGDQKKCLDAGADLYLSKPVKMKKLVGLMNKLLSAQSIREHQ